MSRRFYYVPTTISFTLEDGTTKVFIRNEELGHGSFAIVYRVTDQSTSEIYAMKVIPKKLYHRFDSRRMEEKLENEIEIQKMVNHPNIVKSKFQFSDKFNNYFILEYCPGKNMRDYLIKNQLFKINESETIKVLKDVLNGLVYLHNNDIVHYDLKLENFLIDSNGNVKIADFGLSAFSSQEKGQKFTACGTPNYMSPEVLRTENRVQSYKVDIWAIGVSAYIMLFGRGPFEGITKEQTFSNIKKCQYDFPENIEISSDAKAFIKSILIDDPYKRPTAKELLNHPFLNRPDIEKVELNRSSNLPQLIKTSQNIQKVQPVEKLTGIQKLPPIEKVNNELNNKNEVKSSKRSNKISFGDCENKDLNSISEQKKSFNIPNHAVSRYCFYKKHLAYILGNGTVGVCFKDSSRVVMDPKEKFVQFFDIRKSQHEVIEIKDENDLKSENKNKQIKDKKQEKILYVRKIAKYFKKIPYSYELVNGGDYNSSVPLYHVKFYVKNEDAVLFRLNDKNIQVCFNDYNKMIIFVKSKKICFFKSIDDKCALLDMKYVSKMDSNSDELKKFKKSKELISNLVTTI